MAALVATQGPSHLLNWRSASDNFSDKGVSSTSDKGVSSTSDKGVSSTLLGKLEERDTALCLASCRSSQRSTTVV
jgi:hypothetical protein